MKNFLKILFAAIILVAGIFAVSYLQFRFDRSDVEHAVNAVRLTKTHGNEDLTLEEKLAYTYQINPSAIQWTSRIESKVKGVVLVEALVPTKNVEYRWDVDLVRFQVSPKTQEAVSLGQQDLKLIRQQLNP